MSWLRNTMRKLAGCPDPTPDPGPAPDAPCRVPLKFCYFGTQNGDIVATQNHVNMVHIGAWGDWTTPQGRDVMVTQAIDWLREARTADLPAMITVDFCLWAQTNPRIMLPLETSRTYLDQYFSAIRSEGLLEQVVAFYVVDEPNIPEVNIGAQDLGNAVSWLETIASFYWPQPLPTCAIYGWVNNGNDWRGVQHFDWVGCDNYGMDVSQIGARVLQQLAPPQKLVVVPGGGNPWREDPQPFYDYAQAQPRVIMIMPFKWFGSDGIGQNGMAPQYQAIGSKVKETNP